MVSRNTCAGRRRGSKRRLQCFDPPMEKKAEIMNAEEVLKRGSKEEGNGSPTQECQPAAELQKMAKAAKAGGGGEAADGLKKWQFRE